MKEIRELERLGYTFSLEGSHIHYHMGSNPPDRVQSAQLLNCLKTKREEAIEFLRRRSAQKPVWQYLHEAADRAFLSYQSAEGKGDLIRAKSEIQRWARLFAAAAQAEGQVSPPSPWDEWIQSYAKFPEE